MSHRKMFDAICVVLSCEHYRVMKVETVAAVTTTAIAHTIYCRLSAADCQYSLPLPTISLSLSLTSLFASFICVIRYFHRKHQNYFYFHSDIYRVFKTVFIVSHALASLATPRIPFNDCCMNGMRFECTSYYSWETVSNFMAAFCFANEFPCVEINVFAIPSMHTLHTNRCACGCARLCLRWNWKIIQFGFCPIWHRSHSFTGISIVVEWAAPKQSAIVGENIVVRFPLANEWRSIGALVNLK